MDELEEMLEVAPLFDIDLPAKAKYYNQKTKLAIEVSVMKPSRFTKI